MCFQSDCTVLLLSALAPLHILAIDKNWVAPQTISLPSFPGAIQGLGRVDQDWTPNPKSIPMTP